MSPSPALERFNSLPADILEPLLRQCVAVERWAHALSRNRPYPDRDTLFAAVDALTAGLGDAEVRDALADHPRIGERPKERSGTASWSSAEQSGVDGRDTALRAELHTANVCYQERFGHIYLVCATGKSGQQMLADLYSRLDNDPVTELAVVRRELGRIARIRLEKVMTS